MSELYVHFSHFNFKPEQWREAAARYVELEERLTDLGKEDEYQPHDSMAENFERCAVCDETSELIDLRDEFLRAFGETWAKHAALARR